MIRYSSSVHKSDWECSSKSVRGSFFCKPPIYKKSYKSYKSYNLTNLTTLQAMCRHILFCVGCTGRAPHFCAGRTQVQIGKMTFPNYGIACSTRSWDHRGQSEMMEWKPWEPSKIKRTHRSRSFWSPRRRSQSSSAFNRADITCFYPGCRWHSGDAASRRQWTPRYRRTAGW